MLILKIWVPVPDQGRWRWVFCQISSPLQTCIDLPRGQYLGIKQRWAGWWVTSPCTHGASQQPEKYNNGIMQVNCQTVKAEHIW